MTEAECIALKQQAFRKIFSFSNEQQQRVSFFRKRTGSGVAGAGKGQDHRHYQSNCQHDLFR